ncbi:MAG: hypothetical protein KBC62_00420 [Candidatus Pacebacteria bacterium]|nr:hypothetical protein [Candidatus Paceibacterota bacterium]
MITSIIVILVWEFFCYGFYLHTEGAILEGRNPHNEYDFTKQERTEKEIVRTSMSLGGLCGAMAMAPFVVYALI